MAILQPLVDLAYLCHQMGVTRAIISPGSRSAALTLAFARHPHIQCTVVMDERSAAFIALGMAQQLNKPVALICTSGSAPYNYAPAVAEAFFQQIPLLVLTADRPKEWIHQNDGQTIYQSGIYGKHVKMTVDLSSDYSDPDARWYINRSINEAILTATSEPRGPVHVNIPIREPFYPTHEENFLPSSILRGIVRLNSINTLDTTTWHELLEEWESTDKILIAIGQYQPSEQLGNIFRRIVEDFHVPVVGDVISNLPNHELSITKQDLFLTEEGSEKLQPDLLITTGQSFISKNLKLFLRNNPAMKHWHVSEDLHIIDTLQSLTMHIPVAAEYFFPKLFEDVDYQRFVQNDEGGQDESYLIDWLTEERRAKRIISGYWQNLTSLSDLTAVLFIVNELPTNCQLHVANSMPIRYVNFLGIDKEGVKVFCNRGTSGIDGCVSTAIGAAMITDQPVFLLVGDVAFFYDRNGFMQESLPANLKIVLLNNAGGTIFRMIDGPAKQPELETYFETKHNFNARRTAEDSNISYFHCSEELVQLTNIWQEFVHSESIALLEIKTNSEYNTTVLKGLKSAIRQR
jgi:2-succinyl-5-enolpyruvyl-6-hydroxy-3-cyclohexene-1-carboxylate synthase